jgi:hypothetical protein
MRAFLLSALLCLGPVACGTEDTDETNTPATDPYKATVNGSVGNITIGAADAAWVKSAREYLYIGEKVVGTSGTNTCLDMRAAPALLNVGFNGGLRAGTHSLVTFAQAEQTSGTYASLDTPDVRVHATGGTVTVSKEGERFTGSFDIDFDGQRLTGTFETQGPALNQLCP